MERVLDEIEILLPVLGFDVLRPAGHEAGAPVRGNAVDVGTSPTAAGADPSPTFIFTESGTNAESSRSG